MEDVNVMEKDKIRCRICGKTITSGFCCEWCDESLRLNAKKIAQSIDDDILKFYQEQYKDYKPWLDINCYGEHPGDICCQRATGKYCYEHDPSNYVVSISKDMLENPLEPTKNLISLMNEVK